MYILDANIFIQSNRAHYGFDFVPAFWEWLDYTYETGKLISIQPIAAEIAAGADELSRWAAARPDMFVEMDAACGPSLAKVAAWANGGHFTPAAVSEFLSVADYQLVAYAHAHKSTVVTLERPEPSRRRKVKVPDACNAHGVSWKTPFEMLRTEKASFILAS